MGFKVSEQDRYYAEYILNILKTDPVKIMSWGFCKPTIIHNGLRCSDNGFIHKGWVDVVLQEADDNFTVKPLNQIDTSPNPLNPFILIC